jgi:hypothetical protein
VNLEYDDDDGGGGGGGRRNITSIHNRYCNNK